MSLIFILSCGFLLLAVLKLTYLFPHRDYTLRIVEWMA